MRNIRDLITTDKTVPFFISQKDFVFWDTLLYKEACISYVAIDDIRVHSREIMSQLIKQMETLLDSNINKGIELQVSAYDLFHLTESLDRYSKIYDENCEEEHFSILKINKYLQLAKQIGRRHFNTELKEIRKFVKAFKRVEAEKYAEKLSKNQLSIPLKKESFIAERELLDTDFNPLLTLSATIEYVKHYGGKTGAREVFLEDVNSLEELLANISESELIEKKKRFGVDVKYVSVRRIFFRNSNPNFEIQVCERGIYLTEVQLPWVDKRFTNSGGKPSKLLRLTSTIEIHEYFEDSDGDPDVSYEVASTLRELLDYVSPKQLHNMRNESSVCIEVGKITIGSISPEGFYSGNVEVHLSSKGIGLTRFELFQKKKAVSDVLNNELFIRKEELEFWRSFLKERDNIIALSNSLDRTVDGYKAVAEQNLLNSLHIKFEKFVNKDHKLALDIFDSILLGNSLYIYNYMLNTNGENIEVILDGKVTDSVAVSPVDKTGNQRHIEMNKAYRRKLLDMRERNEALTWR